MVRELAKGFELRGYKVLVLHRENVAPHWLQHPKKRFLKYLSLVAYYFFILAEKREA